MAFLSWKPLNSVPNTKNACVFILMFVWWFLMTITLSPPPVGCIPAGTKPGIMCKNIERQALLILKAGLVDKAGRLSSWSDDNPNCCNWKGVSCSNRTGHVFKLNLRNPFQDEDDIDDSKYFQYMLEGEISYSLLELKYLEYLDLSQNDFYYNKVPSFLGSLEELRYLNLSSSSFSGVVPPSLGNLSRLEYLDLGSNYNGLEVGSWHWLTGMSSLTHLNLDGVDLSKAEGVDDWLGEVFIKLPNLLELHLSDCGLSNLPMSIINHHPINFTSSLSVLDLSSNNFSSSLVMPLWLFNLTALVNLQLYDCSLRGPFNIPHEIGRLAALQHLDLSHNYGIGGQLPTSLGNLTNLVTLNLGSNGLEGRISVTFGHRCKLRELNLSDNRLEGDLHEFIDGLVTCSSDHPRLETLYLFGNKLLGTLPRSLGHLCKLRELDMGTNILEGDIHEFIDGLARCSSDHPHLEFMDLSGNKLLGTLPSSLGSLSNLVSLYLASNSFWGSIPTTIGSLTALRSLYLNSNKLNGTIAETMGRLPPDLETLFLSDNQWREEMLNESHFEKLTKLQYLDLSSTSSKEGNLVLNVTQDWLPPFRRSLVYLDLDGVKMTSKKFPRWTQTLRELKYLTLKDCGIADSIPTEFWTSCPNITRLYLSNNAISVRTTFINMGRLLPHLVPAGNLESLVLANNSFGNNGGGSGIEIPSNIHQLAPFLGYLDLSSNSLSGEIPRSISRLQSLSYLILRNNVLTGELTHLHWDNLTSLFMIDLSNNILVGKIPQSLAHLTNLRWLLLNDNNLEGEIPALPNLTELRVLNLGGNKLSGNIPPTLASHSPDLLLFSLRGNMLCGTIPLEFCLLSQLQALDLAHNNFTGTIPWCLGNLSTTNADELFGDGTTLVVKGREYEYGPRILSLVHLVDLSHNSLFGNIPESLMNLTAMQTLNLSMNHLTGEIPSNIGLLHDLETLDLSQNHLSGPIPSSISDISSLNYLNLSHNDLSGGIPLSRQLKVLDLSQNHLSGPIPSNIHQLGPSLRYIYLSSNSLSGEIPHSISRLQSLYSLILRNNVLTGELIHLHWDNLTSLSIVDLSNNRLVGKIPQSLAHLENLGVLLLNENILEGEIPDFQNLPSLQILDLGGNKLTGNIPPTLASHNPGLLVFRLRGNLLSGTIPLEFCLLSKLQTLDLAHNNFTGTIPWCLGNLSKTNAHEFFYGTITLVVKGRENKYDAGILRLVHLVDLSHNNLSGNIPESLVNLTAMQTLNLSMNHLTGQIPSNIGLLQDLETLDLSQNHLSGPIPLSIADISYLNFLNLSHNDLSGIIPLSRQLQTLDTNSSSYDGNPLLCGDPLPKKCPGDGTLKDHIGEGEENVGHSKRRFDLEEWGFVLSIILGFVVGFWGVCGSLVLKPSWRQAYFGYLEGVKDKIIVVVVVNVARLRRKMGISE